MFEVYNFTLNKLLNTWSLFNFFFCIVVISSLHMKRVQPILFCPWDGRKFEVGDICCCICGCERRLLNVNYYF